MNPVKECRNQQNYLRNEHLKKKLILCPDYAASNPDVSIVLPSSNSHCPAFFIALIHNFLINFTTQTHLIN